MIHTFSKLFGAAAISLMGFIALQAPPFYAQVQSPLTNEAVGSSASLNWAGYVAQEPGSYTSVTGSWNVPNVSRGFADNADATWVGIGGVRSGDLIQAGTQAIISARGNVSYQAWYELLPGVSIPVDLTVSPGDSITATVSQRSPGVWSIVIHDNTTGQQFSRTVRYDSSLSSAEWVQERVSDINGSFYPLDNFGSVTFSNAYAMKDGHLLSLSQLGAQPLTMMTGGGSVLATASTLDQNGSFSVTRQANTPEPSYGVTPMIYSVAPTVPQAVSIPGSYIIITFGPGGITVSNGSGTDTTRSLDANSGVQYYHLRGYHRYRDRW